MFQRVAILGLGAVSGSIGLALRQAEAAQQVAGYDSRKGIADRARKLGAIDSACSQAAEAIRGAELIVLATPISEMRTLLQQMAGTAAQGAVITDVASAKTQVISWAEEFLPPTLSFVGGHPITAQAAEGIESAQAALFQQRLYCLVPTRHTPPAALEKVSTLVGTLGGTVRFLEPAEHDGMVAAIQQLPYLVSIALMRTVGGIPSWHDARLLAEDDLRNATALLASGDPTIYRDSFLANSDPLVRCLNDYLRDLGDLRDRIAAHDSSLEEVVRQAQKMKNEG